MRKTGHNTGLAKVAVQCSADTFVVNQNWFSASTFVVKIATFAKPENVNCNFKMTTLTRILITILTLFSLTSGYGQTKPISEQDLELTEKNIKRLFSLIPDICCPAPPSEWTACYNTDSTYATSDTVILYNDMYYYLTTHCCYVTNWTFSNSTTFSLSETKVCQEPPPSSISFDNIGLKIRFYKKDENLIMSIYKNGKLKDKFILLSLENCEMKRGKQGYKLTMLRTS